MELHEFLAWIISGGGAGVLAYLLMGQVAGLASLAPKCKRAVTFLLSAVLAMAAYTVAAYAGYQDPPQTGFVWVEKLFLVASTSFGLATLIHTRELKPEG